NLQTSSLPAGLRCLFLKFQLSEVGKTMLPPIFITHQRYVPDSSKPYTFRGAVPHPKEWKEAMSLLALIHTPAEHALYTAMLKECAEARTDCGAFSVRHLMLLTGLNSYSTVRRGRNGLLRKKSIEANDVSADGG